MSDVYRGPKKRNNKKSKDKSSNSRSPPRDRENQPGASSSTAYPAHRTFNNQPRVQILKKVDTPPPPVISYVAQSGSWNDGPMHGLPMQYMGPQSGRIWHTSQLEEPTNVAARQAEAIQRQKEAYYFSAQAGTAVSIDTYRERVQYRMNEFPLERNEMILVERKYNLLITPTSSRCNGLFIHVKSQHGDNGVSSGALVHIDSDEKTIRKACLEAFVNFNIVSTKNPTDRCPFSPCSEDYLTKCKVKKVEEKLDAFPDAIYYCDMCDYHFNTISHAKSHLESSSHFDDLERQQQREDLLKNVPEPSNAHLNALNNVLKRKLIEHQSVRNASEERRDSIFLYLKTDLFASIGCDEVTLKVFGSSIYNVMLRDSDLNVAYTTELPSGTPIFVFLEKVRKAISVKYPANHSMDMGTSSTIVFSFGTEETGFTRVRLCWFSSFGYRSQLYFSQLMETYTSLRPEVVEFLQLIRLWATDAGVDSKNKPRIGLPRYGFDIMAIHFLQQAGMLPILHELYSEDASEHVEEQDVPKKVEGRAAEVYAQPMDSPQKNDDTGSVILPEEARQRRMRLMSKYLKNVEKIRSQFDLTKRWDMAKLWIGFFRYYVQHHRELVVQITQKDPITKDANRWNKKILHVVDPFRSDNVLSIPKVSTWQPFYFNCLLTTFVSFAIPRTDKGPVKEVELYQSKTASPKKKQKDVVARKSIDTVKPLLKVSEEDQYNLAADEVAEEQEREHHVKQLIERLQFDGIKLSALKSEDVEIDEHGSQVYSRRTLQRCRRVHSKHLSDKLTTIGCPELLTEKTSKKWNRMMKRKLKNQMSAESVKEDEETESANKEVAEITERVGALNVSAITECAATPERQPTPPVESSWRHWEDYRVPTPQELRLQETVKDVQDEQKEKKEESKASDNQKPQSTTIPSGRTSQPATFVKQTVATDRLTERLICTEDFFIRDKVEFKEILALSKGLRVTDFRFEFCAELFCGGYEMEMKCTHCDGNHCVENCPMMEIPPIEKFDARSPAELKDIDDIIDDYYQRNILDQKRLQLLERKVKELELHLQTAYQPDVNLTIFGSVMTGLSVGCSDIDICLRFGDGHEPPANRTPKEVIQEVEIALRKFKQAKRVQAIVSAKVPIVKFNIRLDDNETVDVDVSYYNILALYNTKLLKEYTLWTPDHRFAKLALFIKSWAKTCEIGDASRGSLSSYAHTILLISYLQQCDPPVLPRLQEDFRSEIQECRLIENWDTSFVEAEDRLIKGWAKNKDTCAQLLLGYLDYYSRFDFRNFVVQCRREMILSKVEKEWPRPLCVEDPFDLNHNLSSGVTKKMFVFVMKVFIASRAAFMSAKPEVPRDSSFLSAYRNQLFRICNQGSAPSERQCHQCHRIGHFYEACPQRAQGNNTKRRYGSNSTNSSYRSNGVGRGDMDRLTYHKRPFNRRSHN